MYNSNRTPEFWPENTDTDLYIPSRECFGETLSSIIDAAKEKWPNASMKDIIITSELINTHCLAYDLYDSADWTYFIHLELVDKTHE